MKLRFGVMMARPYAILDVFTETPLEGNPLAVVLEAEGINSSDMQRIAREFNLSETVFVLPPENPAHTAKLRIFTPTKELPFAGHPTVGSAVYLAKRTLGEISEPSDIALLLEENIGLVRTGVLVQPGKTGHATFTLPSKPTFVSPTTSRVLIAEALSLHEEDIGFGKHKPAVYSAGNPFALVPLNSLDAVRHAKPDLRVWEKAFSTGDAHDAYVYCQGGETGNTSFHARMFGPFDGMPEDPATGSAVAAFAGAIMDFEKPEDGHQTYIIEQGYEMGRPSNIMLELDVEDGDLFAARIGGSAIIVSEGKLYL